MGLRNFYWQASKRQAYVLKAQSKKEANKVWRYVLSLAKDQLFSIWLSKQCHRFGDVKLVTRLSAYKPFSIFFRHHQQLFDQHHALFFNTFLKKLLWRSNPQFW